MLSGNYLDGLARLQTSLSVPVWHVIIYSTFLQAFPLPWLWYHLLDWVDITNAKLSIKPLYNLSQQMSDYFPFWQSKNILLYYRKQSSDVTRASDIKMKAIN